MTRQWSVGDRSDNADDITVTQKPHAPSWIAKNLAPKQNAGVGAPTIWRPSYVSPIRFGKETLRAGPLLIYCDKAKSNFGRRHTAGDLAALRLCMDRHFLPEGPNDTSIAVESSF